MKSGTADRIVMALKAVETMNAGELDETEDNSLVVIIDTIIKAIEREELSDLAGNCHRFTEVMEANRSLSV